MLQNMQNSDQSTIRVVIRKRPLAKKQINRSETDVVEVICGHSVKVREHKLKVDLTKYVEQHSFKFDSAFDEQTSNQNLYENCIRPIIECAFLGGRVTCFAYGQTGSGKTYTMNGDLESGCPGIYYLGAEDIFALRDSSYSHLAVSVSFFEIYCGKLYDLLNNREQLQAREDGKQNVNIVGLTVKSIRNSGEFMEAIAHGSSVRITSQNSTNSDSSRSHAILQISLMSGKKIFGKISFIDLAGCERGADTIDQNKQTKIDGAEINKSLLALKQCIRALDQGKNHTPFRGSKLTMVLKDSFTGFCRTVMIGNVSPGSGSCENTLNTLRYADRVKQLKKTATGQLPKGPAQLSKEEMLARQLMLPRSQNNKQILRMNESESDEELCTNPKPKQKLVNQHSNETSNYSTQKQTSSYLKNHLPQSRPSTAMLTKKLKYLGKLGEDEDNSKKSHLKDRINDSSLSLKNSNNHQNKCRKGIMGNANAKNNENTANRSVNAALDKNNARIHRNKSVLIGNKMESAGFGKQVKRMIQFTASQTERSEALQNLREIRLHQEPKQKNNVNHVKSKINLQKIQELNMHGNFKKMKTQQNQEAYNSYLQNKEIRQWEIILNKFRAWKPNRGEFQEMSIYFSELVNCIMKQELEINELHKALLIKQQSALSQSLSLYNEAQTQSKNNSQMFQYTHHLNTLLDKRIEGFNELKSRVELYRYHLKQHQTCQDKLMEAGECGKERGTSTPEKDMPLW